LSISNFPDAKQGLGAAQQTQEHTRLPHVLDAMQHHVMKGFSSMDGELKRGDFGHVAARHGR
jgi:hypothetical protein